MLLARFTGSTKEHRWLQLAAPVESAPRKKVLHCLSNKDKEEQGLRDHNVILFKESQYVSGH